jgi:hypothetical protein
MTPPDFGSDPAIPNAPLNPARDEAAWKQMRALVHAIGVSVLILTGTLFVYLYRQVVLVRRQTSEMVKFLVDYEHSSASEYIARMHQRFAEFRKQNPDFTPIYIRYFGTNEPPAASKTSKADAATGSKVTPLLERGTNAPEPAGKTR